MHYVGELQGNKECVTRFTTEFESKGNFFTDNNGFLWQQRKYNESVSLPIPGNFYPMNRFAAIQDSNEQFNSLLLLSDRSHGVSSQVTLRKLFCGK